MPATRPALSESAGIYNAEDYKEVKGELVKQGKRTFQNARHREMTPFFMIRLQR